MTPSSGDVRLRFRLGFRLGLRNVAWCVLATVLPSDCNSQTAIDMEFVGRGPGLVTQSGSKSRFDGSKQREVACKTDRSVRSVRCVQ